MGKQVVGVQAYAPLREGGAAHGWMDDGKSVESDRAARKGEYCARPARQGAG